MEERRTTASWLQQTGVASHSPALAMPPMTSMGLQLKPRRVPGWATMPRRPAMAAPESESTYTGLCDQQTGESNEKKTLTSWTLSQHCSSPTLHEPAWRFSTAVATAKRGSARKVAVTMRANIFICLRGMWETARAEELKELRGVVRLVCKTFTKVLIPSVAHLRSPCKV